MITDKFRGERPVSGSEATPAFTGGRAGARRTAGRGGSGGALHGRLAGLLLGCGVGLAQGAAPVVDAHVHYKWDQAEVTSAQQAVHILEQNDVELAVVMGTPPELALDLRDLAPERVVPIFGPYRSSGEWYAWQFRKGLVEEAREALASGAYRGIGELHLIGGYAARWERSPVLAGLLQLAREHRVPVLLHVEFARPDPMLALCREYGDVRLILAHAGAPMPVDGVRRVLEGCPRVWIELAARDPWRYVRSPITTDEGRLLPEWEALVLAYPTRFLIGSDTVWPVDRAGSWAEPDTGWDRMGDFLGFHRRWIGFLPPPVAQQVRRDNARRLFLGY